MARPWEAVGPGEKKLERRKKMCGCPVHIRACLPPDRIIRHEDEVNMNKEKILAKENDKARRRRALSEGKRK